jgi:hypothetical protein
MSLLRLPHSVRRELCPGLGLLLLLAASCGPAEVRPLPEAPHVPPPSPPSSPGNTGAPRDVPHQEGQYPPPIAGIRFGHIYGAPTVPQGDGHPPGRPPATPPPAEPVDCAQLPVPADDAAYLPPGRVQLEAPALDLSGIGDARTALLAAAHDDGSDRWVTVYRLDPLAGRAESIASFPGESLPRMGVAALGHFGLATVSGSTVIIRSINERGVIATSGNTDTPAPPVALARPVAHPSGWVVGWNDGSTLVGGLFTGATPTSELGFRRFASWGVTVPDVSVAVDAYTATAYVLVPDRDQVAVLYGYRLDGHPLDPVVWAQRDLLSGFPAIAIDGLGSLLVMGQYASGPAIDLQAVGYEGGHTSLLDDSAPALPDARILSADLDVQTYDAGGRPQRAGLALASSGEESQLYYYFFDGTAGLVPVTELTSPTAATLAHGPCGTLIIATTASDPTGVQVALDPRRPRP